MTDSEEIKELLEKEEVMLKEKYSGNIFNMRKSMILDDFDKLKELTNTYLENKLKSKNEEIKE